MNRRKLLKTLIVITAIILVIFMSVLLTMSFIYPFSLSFNTLYRVFLVFGIIAVSAVILFHSNGE